MALSKTFKVDFRGKQVAFENAYIKVTAANADKDKLSATVEVRTEKDGQIIESQKHFCNHNLDGPNALKQAYLYLKTLDQFSDAIDC